MNCIGARTNHPPSMLYDVRHHLPTEVDFLGGAIAREAQRAGVPAPLHTASVSPDQGQRGELEEGWNESVGWSRQWIVKSNQNLSDK